MFKSGYVRAVLKDKSTYPLLLANAGGLFFVCYFGGRKLFEHPDIHFNRDERGFGYTSPAQLKDAEQFRNHTSIFASILSPLTEKLRSVTSPKIENDPLWDITRLKNRVPPPLEHTGAFQDGLFPSVPAVPAPTESVHYSDKVKTERLLSQVKTK